jgi:transcription elongation factor GreA
LGEIALSFLASLPPEERRENQQEVNKFALWHGKERSFGELTAPEVARYAEWVAASATDASKKLAPVRAFLTYAKKERLTETNLAAHLRVKKGLPKTSPSAKQQDEPVILTSQGYAQLKSQLATLKEERPRIAEELCQAAADKDFRENAPLEAARERQEQIEAQIRQLESALKSAVVEEKPADTLKAGLGSTVTLCDLTSKEEVTYTLVDSYEANPIEGKLSVASPIGKALLNRKEGDIVEVAIPVGRLCYQVERIRRRENYGKRDSKVWH